MPRDPEKAIGKLIDGSKLSFIGSVDAEGFPNVKATLSPRKREGVKTISFSANTSSMRVAQFPQKPKACLRFRDRRFFRGVMLRGAMEAPRDDRIKRELLQRGDTLYYPGGVAGPDYRAPRFTASDGR